MTKLPSLTVPYLPRTRVLMTKIWKKINVKTKKLLCFYQKLQFTCPQASVKDVRAIEAFSPQNRTYSTSKHDISSLFSILVVIFALLVPNPDSGSGSTGLIKSGSEPCPFCTRWLLRCQQKISFLPINIGTFTVHVFKDNLSLKSYKTLEIKVFKFFFLFMEWSASGSWRPRIL